LEYSQDLRTEMRDQYLNINGKTTRDDRNNNDSMMPSKDDILHQLLGTNKLNSIVHHDYDHDFVLEGSDPLEYMSKPAKKIAFKVGGALLSQIDIA
jgi:hypothetical protein